MRILTADDKAYFEANGYLVVREVVPAENVKATVDAAFEFLGMDPADPADWYRDPLPNNGMAEMYHHQAMWNNRQYPRLHQVFSDLWDTEKLWVSIDRIGFKPPQHETITRWNNAGFLHLDADIERRPIKFGLQGVLCLVNTAADQGGFHCLPGWHTPEMQDEWARRTAGTPKRAFGGTEIPDDLPLTAVEADAGDMIIWHRALPHGNGRNRSGRPRIAQYIGMHPARPGDQSHLDMRLRSWRERIAPEGPWVIGDARSWEQQHLPPAELTPLGRRLLGLDPWSADAAASTAG